MLLRAFALLTVAAVAVTAQEVRLIAHRGGIVGDQYAENSPGSIQAAIDRGYWMIEVDVRRTKDGRIIIHHDRDFQRFYGDPRQVSDLIWNEIKELRATPGGSRPLLFEEVVRMCSGKIRLMLDIKERDAPEEFYAKIFSTLERENATQPTYSLGGSGPLGPTLIANGIVVSANPQFLREAVDRGEPVAERYYLFDVAARIKADDVAYAQAHGVTPAAGLNTFRYEDAGVEHHAGAKSDAERLHALGVRTFQIDSIYDRYFPGFEDER